MPTISWFNGHKYTHYSMKKRKFKERSVDESSFVIFNQTCINESLLPEYTLINRHVYAIVCKNVRVCEREIKRVCVRV